MPAPKLCNMPFRRARPFSRGVRNKAKKTCFCRQRERTLEVVGVHANKMQTRMVQGLCAEQEMWEHWLLTVSNPAGYSVRTKLILCIFPKDNSKSPIHKARTCSSIVVRSRIAHGLFHTHEHDRRYICSVAGNETLRWTSP